MGHKNEDDEKDRCSKRLGQKLLGFLLLLKFSCEANPIARGEGEAGNDLLFGEGEDDPRFENNGQDIL